MSQPVIGGKGERRCGDLFEDTRHDPVASRGVELERLRGRGARSRIQVVAKEPGRVREIGLFVTSIDTPDHVLTFVAKLFADNVQNFSANPFRRVDLIAQLSNSMDLERTVRTLRERVKHIRRSTS